MTTPLPIIFHFRSIKINRRISKGCAVQREGKKRNLIRVYSKGKILVARRDYVYWVPCITPGWFPRQPSLTSCLRPFYALQANDKVDASDFCPSESILIRKQNKRTKTPKKNRGDQRKAIIKKCLTVVASISRPLRRNFLPPYLNVFARFWRQIRAVPETNWRL